MYILCFMWYFQPHLSRLKSCGVFTSISVLSTCVSLFVIYCKGIVSYFGNLANINSGEFIHIQVDAASGLLKCVCHAIILNQHVNWSCNDQFIQFLS